MAAPIIGLVGLAARAIGKKFAKKYAKGSGKRPVSGLSAETKAKSKALNESLRETNRGLRELNKDMQESTNSRMFCILQKEPTLEVPEQNNKKKTLGG